MTQMRHDNYFRADDYLQYLPAAAYLGIGCVGAKGRSRFLERLSAGVTAYAVMTAFVNIAKPVFREQRPDSDSRNSFPSGHTATAFTGAELMRIEYGPLWGAAGYSVAAAVAFLRVYNGRHWVNDVLAGAGIGILSARIGYWMLPVYRRLFGWDKTDKMNVVSVVPGYCVTDGTVSLSLSMTF